MAGAHPRIARRAQPAEPGASDSCDLRVARTVQMGLRMTNKTKWIGALVATVVAGATAFAGQAERERMDLVNKLIADNMELLSTDCKTPLTAGVEWDGFKDAEAMKNTYQAMGRLLNAVETFCNGEPGNQKAIKGKLTHLVLRFGAASAKIEGKSLVCTANHDTYCEPEQLAKALAKY
jgi:hypothetical protein